MKSRTALLFTSVSALSMISGCSPPKGDATGRAPITDTTPAEKGSSQILITGLSEQADLTAEQLAYDLNELPELSGGPYRSTIVFGDIMNKTEIVPTADFEAFRTKIRARLQQSRLLRDKVRWVENRARVEELRRREGAGGTDLMQESRPAGIPPLKEETTYFLNGEMYRIERNQGRTNQYMMTYNLTRMYDGEVIWSSAPYEIKQVLI